MALSPVGDMMEDDEEGTVHRSLRVVFGRKDVARFRAALESATSGTALFVWEKG